MACFCNPFVVCVLTDISISDLDEAMDVKLIYL